MGDERLTDLVQRVIHAVQDELPPDFELQDAFALLMKELEGQEDAIPEQTRKICELVCATMLRDVAIKQKEEEISSVLADASIQKAQGQVPIVNVDGRKIILPDAIYDVEIVFDDEAKMFVAACPDIHVATEADTIKGVRERFAEIAPEIMQANGQFPERHSVVFNFLEKQPA